MAPSQSFRWKSKGTDHDERIVAAYGAFFIPKSFGTSIAATGGAELALYGFLAFYVGCIAITWWFYTKRGGLLFDVEHRVTKVLAPAAAVGK